MKFKELKQNHYILQTGQNHYILQTGIINSVYNFMDDAEDRKIYKMTRDVTHNALWIFNSSIFDSIREFENET